MECCGDVFLFVHPCLSFKLLPLHLLNIFFLIFVFRANSRNDQHYIDVCVNAMHLRSGHIHMQLIHYASSIATEWLLWRFFVCSFFFQKQNRRLSFRFVCLLRIFFAVALFFKFKSQSLFFPHSNGRLVSMFAVCFMHIYFIVYLAEDLTLIRT